MMRSCGVPPSNGVTIVSGGDTSSAADQDDFVVTI